jgi:hypothetical protein
VPSPTDRRTGRRGTGGGCWIPGLRRGRAGQSWVRRRPDRAVGVLFPCCSNQIAQTISIQYLENSHRLRGSEAELTSSIERKREGKCRRAERVFGGGELASGAAAGPTPEEDEAPLLRAHSGGCSAILFPDCCLGRSGCQRGTTARRRRRTWCGFGGGGSTYRPKKWRRMAGTKCNEYRPMSSGKPSRWPASFVFADHVCSSTREIQFAVIKLFGTGS